MAVVQISRIQLRRGKKNEGAGLPQLASGEMAWAVDTQELYIGSGSVSEGAPAVENVKIVTEGTDVFTLSGAYEYQGGLGGITVLRSLQDRLDEGTVNAQSFGIEPGAVDTALMQDVLNTVASSTNVTLEFDPGTYEFDSTITLPSNTKIRGFGKDVTIFSFTQLGIGFQSAQPAQRIIIEDLTIQVEQDNSTCLVLNQCTNSIIENVKISALNNSPSSLGDANRNGLNLTGLSGVSNNYYRGLEFNNLTYGIYDNSGSSYNRFSDCNFNNLFKGVVFGDTVSNLSNDNSILNSVFDQINNEAVHVINGKRNNIENCAFKNVGSSLAGTSSITSIIRFNSSNNKTSSNTFERTTILQEYGSAFPNNAYLPEIEGVSVYSKNEPTRFEIPYTTTFDTAFTLPLNEINAIKIDYLLDSLSYNVTRKGTINVVKNRVTGDMELSDEYESAGISDDSITFRAITEDASGTQVLRIQYQNNGTLINDINNLTYTYTVMS